MNLNNKVYYDKENDILSIHKGFSSDEKFKGNIDVGKLILDVSTQGKIRGIEGFGEKSEADILGMLGMVKKRKKSSICSWSATAAISRLPK